MLRSSGSPWLVLKVCGDRSQQCGQRGSMPVGHRHHSHHLQWPRRNHCTSRHPQDVLQNCGNQNHQVHLVGMEEASGTVTQPSDWTSRGPSPKARFPATDRLKAADEEGTYDELEKLRIAKRIRKLREQRRKSDREARMNEDGDENSAYHYL